MYLEDLYNFYVNQNQNVKFSSKDTDTTIVVHIDEPLAYSKSNDNDLILNTPIRLCHTQKNINQSFISEKAMKDAIPSAYNMPILGYIYQDDEGEYKFAGHEFFINDNNEIEYEEVPVGCIPESAGLSLVYDDDMDKTYLDGNGIIWRTYSKAAEILEREQQLSVSVELIVDELSYDSNDKVLVIDKFRFSGVTILEADRETGEEIKPGMVGANISISDFSEKNNSIFSNKQVIELLSDIKSKLDNLNINENYGKEEHEPMKKKFEEDSEVAEAEVKETPSATFDGEPGEENPEDDPNYYEEEGSGDGEGGNDNDPPADDPIDPTDPPADDPVDPPVDPPADPPADDDDDDEPETIPLGQKDDDDTAGSAKKSVNSIEYAVTIDGIKKEYSVTLRDKLMALTTLINDNYGEMDGCYYDCDVDEDNKTVIMHDYWNNKHYRQLYSVKKGVYSLKGDRTEIFVQYLSQDEIDALEQMKANYSSIQDRLSQYESEPDKIKLIQSKDYAQIVNTDAYQHLAKRETYFSMSIDEVRDALDNMLLDFAKHNKIEFAVKETPKESYGVKQFGTALKSTSKSTGKGRYGGTFLK